MKRFILILFSALAMQCRAATPAAESAFLAAVKRAIEADDAPALTALVCWDGVPAAVKEEFAEFVGLAAGGKVQSIALEPLPPGAAQRAKTSLVPSKVISLSIAGSDGETRRLAWAVGEKAGRVMIASPREPLFPAESNRPPTAQPATKPQNSGSPATPVNPARALRLGENLVANSDFAQAGADGRASGWDGEAKVASESGAQFLRLDNTGAWSFTSQNVALPAGAKSLKGSFRVRLKTAQDPRSNTTLFATCLDAAGNELKRLALAGSRKTPTDWTESSAGPQPLPSGTATVKVNISSRGLIDLDDVRVIAE